MNVIQKVCPPIFISIILITTSMFVINKAVQFVSAQGAIGVNVNYVGAVDSVIKTVFLSDNYGYIGEGRKLVILDLRNPPDPTVLSKSTPFPTEVQDVFVDNSYAYVANGSAGLRVVDVSDPINPTEIGFYDSPGNAQSVFINGSYAYVADGSDGLRIVDVSDPVNPTEIGYYNTPGNARGVFISAGYAYVADNSSGLRIVDISDPTKPSEVAIYDTPRYVYDVVVSDDYAYVAAYNDGLRIVDVSDPTNPNQISVYQSAGNVKDVAIDEEYTYLIDDYYADDLRIIDVSDPISLTEVGSYNTSGGAAEISIQGDYAYVANGSSGLQVLDVRSLSDIFEIGSYSDTSGTAMDVVIRDDYAYVAQGEGGLRVVDISDPINPVLIGSFKTPGYARGVTVNGDYAYIADSDYNQGGLRVIDVSDPANPKEMGSYLNPGTAWNVATDGEYVYIAAYNAGLRIVDVSDPFYPTEIGYYNDFYEIGRGARDVFISGNYAYVAHETGGLRIVDVTDPGNPTEVGFYDTPGNAKGVVTYGRYAYIADEDQGLRVVDVNDPASPIEVGFYDTSGFSYDIAVNDNYAYIADGYWGLRIVDISEPTNPTEVGSYSTLGWNYGVYVKGDMVFVAEGIGSLLLALHHDKPASPTATPTPFNTDTPPATGDNYEEDNVCTKARVIAPDGTVQEHTLHVSQDEDWVVFHAHKDFTYRIEGRVPPTSTSDLVMQLYEQCIDNPESQQPIFSPDIYYQFTAVADGPIFLRLLNEDTAGYGTEATYQLSVRPIDQIQQHGALIIVAGCYKQTDPLQTNIYNVTNRVYQIFRRFGHPKSNIYYLAPDQHLDPDSDGSSDVDNLPSRNSLQYAIIQWAKDKVDPDRALTLFMMDHGKHDEFFLDDTKGEILTPSELDNWLDQLESETGAPINVVVEACASGSFIDADETISGSERLLVTSSDAYAPSYATTHGALFADTFLSTLQTGSSIRAAFDDATWAAMQLPVTRDRAEDQIPWLNGDDNTNPNQISDLALADQRSLVNAGSFPVDSWPPYMSTSEIRNWNGITGKIWARVLDDDVYADNTVWAVIYPPSYRPPVDVTEIVPEPQRVPLLKESDIANGAEYGADWLFLEKGTYKVIIYAQDGDGLLSHPYALTLHTVQEVYLPLIIKNEVTSK